MTALQYLTVQDILWINLQLTKKVQRYNFAKLEEAAFFQYAYGDSNNLVNQSARFIPGFIKMQPFEDANEATAFVAGVAFLVLNNRKLTACDGDQAVKWFGQAADKHSAKEAVCSGTEVDTSHHHHDVRSAVELVMREFPKAIKQTLSSSTDSSA